MNYLSKKLDYELTAKGYRVMYEYKGKSFYYLKGLDIVKRLRNDGYCARLFASGTAVYDCPHFYIYYKKKGLTVKK